ncbi:MAG: hypothetical protein A3F04_00540 [Candidatus Chisholmbacteria bacterium RIFCSPHIGHO2_12_FULL_49_9]|uniref:Glycosyltransferase RgtA/B/C/D-like domain-containing protein n=1 Tax=Candidatus Chisholmbacteria bacterium RIFCSPHIGHO2_01_FULL_52_32 TaxID=1797591 RepID=A0A1G1VT19_9BACT|nr:MAG: hypothetical protein A2786_03545 [Candidatus Chisholmbacteria bacterium RIFCSPHIGHO2_01_FULL_52_32]OGY20083.1 MAG: hypothetical protein A2900_03200 [Candidatus Chisholmbacteria bacterium RIFCSPLOWO2_01_FULL_50_28]OGY20985.1 MAG: hypothetical protein A3F04_00540 [Candidatus Chisholmbacteria bacterium RIFCSPHIGHO2_12_FULL_49_9]
MKKLYLILILAAILRLLWLDRFPAGFDMDEVQVGYNAYSILKTLRDENGNFLPLHTSFYNEARPMLSMYLTSPWIALFGVNVFAVRFSVALLGVFAVFLTYVLVKKLFDDEQLALLSSALFAVSPWHIILSRSTTDGALGLVFFLGSMLLLVSWVKSKGTALLLLTYLSWVVTYFSYIGVRPFIYIHALFWIIFLLVKHRKSQALVLSLMLALFTVLPVWVTIQSGAGLARYRQIGNITPQSAVARLQTSFLEDGGVGLPIVVTRLFHNKVENSAREFFREYFKYVSLNFLFVQGGYPTRYVVPEQTLQYWFEAPFFLLGLFAAVKRFKLSSAYALFWFLAGGLPAALTTEDAPNIQRSVFMLPGFQIITAMGFVFVYRKVQKRAKLLRTLVTVLFVVGVVWEIGRFSHQYTIHQPLHQPWNRNIQFPEIVAYVNQVQSKYDKILISKSGTEPYLYFLFFTKTDPSLAQKLVNDKRNVQGDWDFGEKVRFVRDPCPLNERTVAEGKTLYGNVGECGEVKGAKVVNVVRRPDQTIAMQFLTKE